jgi:basic amino acid/polyamine antiporter, APA family
LLQASALMFVAYTGYGRIATLGEEVCQPQRTIPRAILITLGLTAGLYLAVALVSVGSVGSVALSLAAQTQTAPLEIAARSFGVPGAPQIVALGAVTAMLGVLLNLVLGLSRVLLAMGRRGDMPTIVARLTPQKGTQSPTQNAPSLAVGIMGSVIGVLVLVGNVKTTWSFSAFNVLIYYAITNWAALRLPRQQQLYPRWIAGLGCGSCLLLAFWVDAQIWQIGLGLIAVGLTWKQIADKGT